MELDLADVRQFIADHTRFPNKGNVHDLRAAVDYLETLANEVVRLQYANRTIENALAAANARLDQVPREYLTTRAV